MDWEEKTVLMYEHPSVRELSSGSISFPSQGLVVWDMDVWLRKGLHGCLSLTWNSRKPSNSSDFPKRRSLRELFWSLP